MRRVPLLSMVGLMLALSAGSGRADVWKWVDADGHAQYSDRWVPGAQLIKSEHGHATSSGGFDDDSRKLAERSAEISAQLDQQAAARAVEKDRTAARNEQCKQAKDHYEKTIQARRIYRTGKDGEREYLSDEEADQQRLQARLDMQQACGASASSSTSS